MRQLGFSYKDVEAKGILMPVVEFIVNYKKPAFYDDEITIITYIKKKPEGLKIIFDYECYNSQKELLNTGKVTLVCVDKLTQKMVKLPNWFNKALSSFFK